MPQATTPADAHSRRDFLIAGGAGIAAASSTALTFAADAPSGAGGTDKGFKEHFVKRGESRVYAREWAGEGPTYILMHGFPDNLHIYDRLAPLLAAAGKHVVSFDFLGFGGSDKPTNVAMNFAQQQADLVAVADALGHQKVIPVAHDASGPTAINFGLAQPDRVASMTLLNTLYADSPDLVLPELIQLCADPVLHALAMDILGDPGRFKWMLDFQAQGLIANCTAEQKEIFWSVLRPIFNDNFAKGAGPAFVQMTADLRKQMAYDRTQLPKLRGFRPRVDLIWGTRDAYLKKGMAEEFSKQFRNAKLATVSTGHWPQVDMPQQVARLMVESA